MTNNGIDLGKLQVNYETAARNLKASTTKLHNAQTQNDKDKEAFKAADEALTEAVRAVRS